LVSNGFLDLWVVIRSYKLLFLALSRPHESRIPLLKRCNTGLTRSAPQLLNTIFSRKISTTWMRAVFQSVPSRHRRLLSINIFGSVIKLNLVVKSGLHRSNVFVPMACKLPYQKSSSNRSTRDNSTFKVELLYVY